MQGDKLDRRIRYTTQLLKSSLITLLQTAPISRISVKMLCEEADVNRSTFYAHFTDQYDLLHRVEQEAVSDLRAHINSHDMSAHSEQATQALKQILDYVSQNAGLFRVLLSENGDSDFQKDLMAIAQEKTISDIRQSDAVSGRTSEYLQSFVLAGALRLVQKWLSDGMLETTQEIAELTSILLYKGTSGFYPSQPQ